MWGIPRIWKMAVRTVIFGGISLLSQSSYINVIGAGLAGSEAAYQIAKRGIPVKLYEMRRNKSHPHHLTHEYVQQERQTSTDRWQSQ